MNSRRQVGKILSTIQKNTLDCCCYTCCQGSICIPREVYDNTDNAGQGVASAIEFNNKENLLFPLFQNNPQTNLSTVISFSINSSSEVQITDESSPIRITFNQVKSLFPSSIWMTSSILQPSDLQSVFCGYWDANDLVLSSKGCRLNKEFSDNEKTVCECFHLTRFDLVASLTSMFDNYLCFLTQPDFDRNPAIFT